MQPRQQQQQQQQFASSFAPRTPTKPRSSILAPISPNKLLSLSPTKERKISESTGLVKFSLSPKKSTTTTTPKTTRKSTILATPTKPGLSIEVPISSPLPKQQNPPKSLKDLQIEQQNLLEKYSTYQAQLHEHERQAELKKLELLEISKKIEESKRQEAILNGSQDIYKQAYLQTEKELNQLNIRLSPPRQTIKQIPLKKQASFLMNQAIDECTNVKKKASIIFNNHTTGSNNNREMVSPLKKQASFIVNQALDECNNVKQKASMIFNNQNEELQTFIKSSNEKFDVLAKQTNKFFNNNFKIFEKNDPQPNNIADSSFNIENLEGVIYERSFEIDIDDYDSSFD